MRNTSQLAQTLYNRFALRAHRGAIGIGLIGIGGWGANNAINIMRCRRFSILGIHDIKSEIMSQFGNSYRIKCFHKCEELLSEPKISAVCITVPNNCHKELVKAAADAGKHVFIEKPLASYSEDCIELGQYCSDAQIILQVGHQMRRDPVFREIKRLVEGGSLGRPLFVQGVNTLNRRNRNDWRRNSCACPSGSMEQLGVHLIDVLIYLFGNPIATNGWAENIPTVSNNPDWGHVSLIFDHGLHATISTSFSSHDHIQLEFFFERAHLVTNGQTLWISCSGKPPIKTLKPKGTQGSVAQFIEFADCIEQGKEPETGATQAAAVMDVVQSITRRKDP